jgi:hypothetical protein
MWKRDPNERRIGLCAEHLRLVMAEVQVATVRNQVALSPHTDFENFSVVKPHPRHKKSADGTPDQVIAWGGA